MNKCSCFLLFSIFALTTSISLIKLKDQHRSYYQAVAATDHINEETKDDDNDDTENLYSRNNFVAKVKDGKKTTKLVITPEVETFTDFIQETVDILNTYDNTAFKDFFHILDTEIRKYHYEGCRFAELMQNRNTRTLLAGALKSVRENTVTFTKANINEIADLIRYEMNDEHVKELLNYINSLYITTERDFIRILNNLKLHTNMKSRETHNYLEQVIRDGVRTVLFNHYTDLNTQTRRELKEKIEKFWEKYKKRSASKDEMNSIVKTDPVSNPAIDNVKTIDNNPKELEPTQRDPKTFLGERKRIVDKDTYDEQFKDNKMKKERIFESDKLTTNDNEEDTSSEESDDNADNTKSAIQTKPVLRAQVESEPETRNTNEKPSTYTTTTESSHSKLENTKVLKDIKPKRKSADRFNKTGEINFLNKFVNSKLPTLEKKLNELKQLNILAKRLIHIDSDEDVQNFTDSIEIIGEDNTRRHMNTDIMKLLQDYYDVNKDEIDDAVKHSTTRRDKIKTKTSTKTNKRSDGNVAKMRADDTGNINENTTGQVLRKNVNDIVTKELKPTASSNDTTSTNTQTVVAAVTVPTAGNNARRQTVSDPNRIIRHKNPLEFVPHFMFS
ncbi:hypothetical protein PYW07_012832 [Mythimna separata]|uniref:Uncharacterized protein n=1 Tax=Mythimna separata TaxID=271217 RepID=A0AAD7Y8Q0_MYTSE|nr:hypothetical protein PYW07_012832 [Mythimna separata]